MIPISDNRRTDYSDTLEQQAARQQERNDEYRTLLRDLADLLAAPYDDAHIPAQQRAAKAVSLIKMRTEIFDDTSLDGPSYSELEAEVERLKDAGSSGDELHYYEEMVQDLEAEVERLREATRKLCERIEDDCSVRNVDPHNLPEYREAVAALDRNE